MMSEEWIFNTEKNWHIVMEQGAIVELCLGDWSDEDVFLGVVTKGRKWWAYLLNYPEDGRIADENTITKWRYVSPEKAAEVKKQYASKIQVALTQ